MPATQTQQPTPSKQLAACAYWLVKRERLTSSYWRLIDLYSKEKGKARPSKATMEALFDGACAANGQLFDALDVILRRGGLLFVGVAGAARAAAELKGGAA